MCKGALGTGFPIAWLGDDWKRIDSDYVRVRELIRNMRRDRAMVMIPGLMRRQKVMGDSRGGYKSEKGGFDGSYS